jgi:hypothetical protein
MALPAGTLPSVVCRARLQGKDFAQQNSAFAVRFRCMAKNNPPVVYSHRNYMFQPQEPH